MYCNQSRRGLASENNWKRFPSDIFLAVRATTFIVSPSKSETPSYGRRISPSIPKSTWGRNPILGILRQSDIRWFLSDIVHLLYPLLNPHGWYRYSFYFVPLSLLTLLLTRTRASRRKPLENVQKCEPEAIRAFGRGRTAREWIDSVGSWRVNHARVQGTQIRREIE